ncbi:hypothetical protein NDU88_005678 [Pleurodeles waltl]|uniref:Uncharacterized protein n=1 Tax=Pleurodeles waltl TaxID=8319 RepID=A0AAV7L886_PLEWA|nr:hypothetical protein NDU88_005678 [Pleurodeles waltl]
MRDVCRCFAYVHAECNQFLFHEMPRQCTTGVEPSQAAHVPKASMTMYVCAQGVEVDIERRTSYISLPAIAARTCRVHTTEGSKARITGQTTYRWKEDAMSLLVFVEVPGLVDSAQGHANFGQSEPERHG